MPQAFFRGLSDLALLEEARARLRGWLDRQRLHAEDWHDADFF